MSRLFSGIADAIEVDKHSISDDDDEKQRPREWEEKFKTEWFGFEEALNKLTFESDREVIKNAIGVLRENSFSWGCLVGWLVG